MSQLLLQAGDAIAIAEQVDKLTIGALLALLILISGWLLFTERIILGPHHRQVIGELKLTHQQEVEQYQSQLTQERAHYEARLQQQSTYFDNTNNLMQRLLNITLSTTAVVEENTKELTEQAKRRRIGG
jgi:hypothetical protein